MGAGNPCLAPFSVLSRTALQSVLRCARKSLAPSNAAARAHLDGRLVGGGAGPLARR